MVVVSEETGDISLIRDGRITKGLNESSLHNALRRLTMAIHKKAQKLFQKAQQKEVEGEE